MTEDVRKVEIAERRLYSVKEAAALLGRCEKWVALQVKAGTLVGILMPRLMIHGPSINRFLRERMV